MTLARWEIILLAIQIEDLLPFSSQKLMIGVGRCAPKHETRLLIDFLVTILEGSSS